MAAANTFNAALGRIGINPATRAAIRDNGFDTILDLATVQEDDLNQLPKHIMLWRDPAVDANHQVRIPFVSLKKLKAMRYWVVSQCCMGIEAPRAQDFTEPYLKPLLLG
jgi:hypothetical protein